MCKVPARLRLLEATYVCVARHGLAKTTVEDVARASGLSRATIYRHFPGGREELIRAVIAWEVTRFFETLTAAVAGAGDLSQVVEEALLVAHAAVEGHAVLQTILQTEPERLLPELTVESARILAFIRAFLLPHVEADPRAAAADPVLVADFGARMLLSFIGAPGTWDLTDRSQVRWLVRAHVLPGLGLSS